MNKRGFTLVELLAIIVILAVIMVIAVPQILNVVDGSKSSAWKDNVKMIEKSIELNSQIFDPDTGEQKYSLDSLCTSATTLVPEIAESSDTTVACEAKVFTLTGTGQFEGKGGKVDCSGSGCKSCSTGTDCTAQ